MNELKLISDLWVIMPELSLASLGLVALLIGTLSAGSSRFIGYLIILSLVYLSYSMNQNPENYFGEAFAGSYFNSNYILLFKSIMTGLMAIIFWGYVATEKKVSTDFMMLGLFSLIGNMIALSAKDLLLLFLGLELGSLPSYILAGFLRDKLKSSEAGLKYFVLGSVSSAIMLFGISLIYGFTGSISYEVINQAIIHVANIGVLVGVSMILISFLFKMSIAPFHIWTPDVYEGAPIIPVTVFSSVHKISIIAIFVAFLSMIMGKYSVSFDIILKFFAGFSLIVGSFGGLMQQSLKRLMAYSTILNSGYVLLAIIADIYVGFTRNAFFTYIIIYSISVIAFFLIIKSVYGDKSNDLKLKDLAGLSKKHKFMSFSLVIILSSMIGIPPLAGFFAKYYVLYNLISIEEYVLAVIAIISSVLAAFYYLRIIKAIYFDESKNLPKKVDTSFAISLISSVALVFLVCFPICFAPYFNQIKLLI